MILTGLSGKLPLEFLGQPNDNTIYCVLIYHAISLFHYRNLSLSFGEDLIERIVTSNALEHIAAALKQVTIATNSYLNVLVC